jgi:hypothetical protein
MLKLVTALEKFRLKLAYEAMSLSFPFEQARAARSPKSGSAMWIDGQTGHASICMEGIISR